MDGTFFYRMKIFRTILNKFQGRVQSIPICLDNGYKIVLSSPDKRRTYELV
jgi:hypothetical protein